METSKRPGYIAEITTDYIDTTDVCMELFFWPVTSADGLYKPHVSIVTVTESKTEVTQAKSSGYEPEAWNRLFARLPSGIHKVLSRVHSRPTKLNCSSVQISSRTSSVNTSVEIQVFTTGVPFSLVNKPLLTDCDLRCHIWIFVR